MRVAPGRRRAALGKTIVATTQLLEEVAISQYALHAGIHLQHIKSVWRDLWGHVATQLLTGKVRLPSHWVRTRTFTAEVCWLMFFASRHAGSCGAGSRMYRLAVCRGLCSAEVSASPAPAQQPSRALRKYDTKKIVYSMYAYKVPSGQFKEITASPLQVLNW